MNRRPFNYLQAIVALGLIAFGAFLLMTGTALIAVVVSTVALMLVFIQFLFGRKTPRPVEKNGQSKATGNPS